MDLKENCRHDDKWFLFYVFPASIIQHVNVIIAIYCVHLFIKTPSLAELKIWISSAQL